MPKKSNWTNPPSKEAVEQAEKSISATKSDSKLDEVEEILLEFRDRLFEISDDLDDIGICTCCIGNVLVDVAAWYFSHGKEHTKYKTRKLFLREAKDAIEYAFGVRRKMDQEQ